VMHDTEALSTSENGNANRISDVPAVHGWSSRARGAGRVVIGSQMCQPFMAGPSGGGDYSVTEDVTNVPSVCPGCGRLGYA
jgi:hypothetical protein